MDLSSSTTRIFGLSIGLQGRYPQGKCRTFPNLTIDRNIAAVFNRDLFNKCQPKAKPALLASFLVATAIKLFKHLCRLIPGDTTTLIGYLEPDAVIPIYYIKTHNRAG